MTDNWYPRALELFAARGLDYDAARVQALSELSVRRKQCLDVNERPNVGTTSPAV